jgi:hypothetical protein
MNVKTDPIDRGQFTKAFYQAGNLQNNGHRNLKG